MKQGHSVINTSQTSLLQTLQTARATGSYNRKLKSLVKVPLLIIDDFGLKPLRTPQDEDLHDLIAQRYEQAATIDRLQHGAHVLTLSGVSYRAKKQTFEKLKEDT